jgi:hypothetical protein
MRRGHDASPYNRVLVEGGPDDMLTRTGTLTPGLSAIWKLSRNGHLGSRLL